MKFKAFSPARALAAGLACLAVSACSAGSGGRVASTPSAQVAPAGEVDAIIALLETGKSAAARKRINAGLKKSPNNPALMVLHDSITRNPQELLGPENYRYTVRAGDTMTSLARRFLGNRLKFYQLSRYNGIDVPSSLQVGQVINIPGRLAPPPQQATERPRPPTASAPRDKPKAVAVPAAPAAPARPGSSPAAAMQARSAGLAALNAGQPARAVTLLSRAAALAPDNAVIARDLVRARRIAATVGSK